MLYSFDSSHSVPPPHASVTPTCCHCTACEILTLSQSEHARGWTMWPVLWCTFGIDKSWQGVCSVQYPPFLSIPVLVWRLHTTGQPAAS